MDKLRMETPDLTTRNIDKIAALFPNCVTETIGADGRPRRAINFDLLRQMLSEDVLEGDEAYEFTWVGKKAAIVEANRPIRKTLRPCPEESVNWDTTENLYIEGDNLEVLKLLQESYLGQVKVIYIDPPYNTGKDSFVYLDDFEMSREDYEEGIGLRDSDDNRLFRENSESNPRFHSDWCSMMYSRLLLARNLLTQDGAIFISIDDNECANLINLCSEVFGADCFVADISWQRTYSPRNDSKGIVREVEHIVVFSKQRDWMPTHLPRTEEMDSKYKNPDNDDTAWRSDNAFAPSAATHQGMVYAIQHPFTGEMLYPPPGRCWPNEQAQMLQYMQGWCPYILKDLRDEAKRASVCGISSESVRQGVKGIVLAESLEASSEKARAVLKRGQWPRFYFTKDGQGGIARKTYLDSVGGKLPTNFWPYSEVGHTDEAKKELKNLFGGSVPFDTPKPVRLIERILAIASDPESLVMDFFSGSATTAHAVMKQNAGDGGKRKFILVQLPEKCDSPNFDTLCDVGKARIHRAGEKIKRSRLTTIDIDDSQLMQRTINDDGTFEDKFGYKIDTPNEEFLDALDIGFRVFKLDDSNMKDVYYAADDYDQANLDMFTSNIKEDRTDLDLLFGCLLEWGLPLSMRYTSEEIEGCTVHTYDPDSGDKPRDRPKDCVNLRCSVK